MEPNDHIGIHFTRKSIIHSIWDRWIWISGQGRYGIFIRETLAKIASYGASIVRLDAFAYAPKAPGRKNFLNEPETWDLLEQIRMYAEPYELTLLPEIHAAYEEHIYQTVAEKGYMTL